MCRLFRRNPYNGAQRGYIFVDLTDHKELALCDIQLLFERTSACYSFEYIILGIITSFISEPHWHLFHSSNQQNAHPFHPWDFQYDCSAFWLYFTQRSPVSDFNLKTELYYDTTSRFSVKLVNFGYTLANLLWLRRFSQCLFTWPYSLNLLHLVHWVSEKFLSIHALQVLSSICFLLLHFKNTVNFHLHIFTFSRSWLAKSFFCNTFIL